MKSILLVFVIFSIGIIAAEEDTRPSKDETWGSVLRDDKLIRRDVILLDPAFTGIAKKTYSFPTSDTPALFPYSRITGVKVLDQYTDGHGAKATLLAGGPDARDLSVQLKSQIYRGIHSIIEVYGQ